MKNMLISINIPTSSSRYHTFKDSIESLGQTREVMPSTWILKTQATPKRVLEYLNFHLESRDRLIVIQVAKDYAAKLPSEVMISIKRMISY